MISLDLTRGIPDSMFYAYAPHSKSEGEFVLDDGCIRNCYNEKISDYDYTTLVLKEKMKLGTRSTVECSFDKYGAPLVVITDALYEKDGIYRYGEHFEAVAFRRGCNVWHNTLPDNPTRKKPVISEKLHFEDIPTEDGTRVKLSVEFLKGEIKVEMNGKAFSVKADVPSEFYLGFTGCEGINRFYSFTVENV